MSGVPPERQEYTEEYFKFCVRDHGEANKLLGDVLYWLFKPESVLDLGCGPGGVISSLIKNGVNAEGVDKHQAAIDVGAELIESEFGRMFSRISIADLERLDNLGLGQFDLAICIEVLEHLPEDAADTTIDTICKTAPVCVITACPPMGRNPLHLNEQFFDYWEAKFKVRGFELDQHKTLAIKSIMMTFGSTGLYTVPSWFYSDWLGVFRKAQ